MTHLGRTAPRFVYRGRGYSDAELAAARALTAELTGYDPDAEREPDEDEDAPEPEPAPVRRRRRPAAVAEAVTKAAPVSEWERAFGRTGNALVRVGETRRDET